MRAPQRGERAFVDLLAFALTHERFAPAVGNEAEPVEILQERAFVLQTTSDAVVVLDSQQDFSATPAGDTPDVDGVHDMAQVQVPCG